jgi:hypothetical protein
VGTTHDIRDAPDAMHALVSLGDATLFAVLTPIDSAHADSIGPTGAGSGSSQRGVAAGVDENSDARVRDFPTEHRLVGPLSLHAREASFLHLQEESRAESATIREGLGVILHWYSVLAQPGR